jgi:hypothetical protein
VLTKLKEQDREIYLTARRVFWTAFILDRFHASGHSKDLMLPVQSGGLSRDDYLALGGDVGYHLARKLSLKSTGTLTYNFQAQQKLLVKLHSLSAQAMCPTLSHHRHSHSRQSPPHLLNLFTCMGS